MNIFPHQRDSALSKLWGSLESAIAKLSHECPTLGQSEDHAGGRRETWYWRRPYFIQLERKW